MELFLRVERARLTAEDRTCLACGSELTEPLAQTGSLRCHDCRDAETPLDPLLCADADGPGPAWRARGAHP